MTIQADHDVRWTWDRPDVLPERLRMLREAFGLTPVTASKAVGFTDQTWRNYEKGQPVKEPVLMAIAVAFERDGDKARELKVWLRDGGELPAQPHPPESTLRLSREPEPAGQERFSGSDIERLCATLGTTAVA